GRCCLVRKAKVVPVECVVRGYLAGSGWKEYQEGGAVCGVALPAGLRQAERLPEPIFTPATKEEHGTTSTSPSSAWPSWSARASPRPCASAAWTSTTGGPRTHSRAG